MTIVELIDVHDGFKLITDRISFKNQTTLLWVISFVAFFLSALLDNLTTSIILCALLRRIIKEKEIRWLFGGFVIISANAGGAWSPIGDITTIMLWIGGQITSLAIMKSLFLVSLISMLVPLVMVTFLSKQLKKERKLDNNSNELLLKTTQFERNTVLILGSLGLIFVPIFKALTHYPPYLGILLALSVLWVYTELLHRKKELEIKRDLSVASMLQRIDTPSILFFLGILLAVAALNTSGHLKSLALLLNQSFGNIYIINTIIGFLSAIVDNVPLVAAAMGMYSINDFPVNHDFWNLLAYCAGTGGSMLIIGSAAGVASMSILKIDFIWYLKKISLYAFSGYISGVIFYYFFQ
jgi:Na+/H+ antiporter NhaD/arsenite permease-like protein